MANATTETKLEPLDFIAPRESWMPSVRDQLVALRDSADLTRGSGGGDKAGAESFPDRVLRVARENGYKPVRAEMQRGMVLVTFAHPTVSDVSPGLFLCGYDDSAILAGLRAWAGPDNQPEAVRARKAMADANHVRGTVPGVTGPVTFKDAVDVIEGACAEAGVFSFDVTQHVGKLTVCIRGTHEQSKRVEELARKALPAYVTIEVFFDGPRDTDVIGARDPRSAPVVGTVQPGDVVEHSTGPIWRAVTEIVRSVDAQVLARDRLRDQLASGGVDCAETRAANVARVKAESDVVGQMQDAIRLVESWPMKRKRCPVCRAAAELVGVTCAYCMHTCHVMRVAEHGPGIAVDNTPGPHDGACAWASATWEEL